jgi:hypothetical protein
VSKKGYGFMEIASAVLTAFIMGFVYFLLYKLELLKYGDLYLALIIMVATTVATVITTAIVVKYVKR